jgi:hypothetical protein
MALSKIQHLEVAVGTGMLFEQILRFHPDGKKMRELISG